MLLSQPAQAYKQGRSVSPARFLQESSSGETKRSAGCELRAKGEIEKTVDQIDNLQKDVILYRQHFT